MSRSPDSALSAPPERCIPPRWAQGGHGQTVWGHLLPSSGVRLSRWPDSTEHIVPLEDGDSLHMRHLPGDSGRLQVVLFHGLSGSIDADYMRRTAAMAIEGGASVLAVNHRGCGEGRGLAAGPYHAGRAEDLGAALRLGRSLEPGAQQIAIGFSLSGNALLLLLTLGGDDLPDGAVAINPPIHLAETSRRIHQGRNRVYEQWFLRRLRASVRERMRDGLLKRERLPRTRSLWEFDDAITAPAAGFHGADDYYERCSTRHRLREIATPTVLLSARDDPFVSARDFEDARLSDAVHLHIEPHGGHLGSLSSVATPLGTKRWLDYALDHYLAGFGGESAV